MKHTLSLSFLLLMAIMLVPFAQAAVIFSDDMETGTASGNGWVQFFGAGNLAYNYSSEVAFDGNNSLRFGNWSGSDTGVGVNVTTMANRTLDMYFYDNVSDQNILIGIITSDFGNEVTLIPSGATYTLETAHNGNPDTGVSRSVGWHHLIINVSSNTDVFVLLDDVSVANLTSEWTTETADAYITAYAYDETESFYDDVQVYTNPIPTPPTPEPENEIVSAVNNIVTLMLILFGILIVLALGFMIARKFDIIEEEMIKNIAGIIIIIALFVVVVAIISLLLLL